MCCVSEMDRSVAGCERKCALGFSQFAARASVLAQRIWRRLLESHAIGFITELLQIAHERLEPPRVAAVGREHAPCVGVKQGGIFASRFWGALPGYRTTLLSARHSVLAAGECKRLIAIVAGQCGIGRHHDGSLRV